MTFMYLSIFDPVEEVTQEPLTIAPASLHCAFEQVKDTRKRRGKRYPLPLVLTLIFLAKLAGETTISGVVDWVKLRGNWIREQLNWPKRFPTNATYTNILAGCDGNEIAMVIAQVIIKAQAVERCGTQPSCLQTEERAEPLTHVAMDGKTLRGTCKHEQQEHPSVHLLSLYDCQSGIVLGQRVVDKKENEIVAAPTLLHPALIKGRILSADAMHTQKKWCAQVHKQCGYYLLITKNNHPQMRQDLIDFFEDKDAERQQWEYHKKPQKGHGRLEVREIWTSTQMNEWFETEWAGIAQVFRLRRLVTTKEKTREEIVYGFTNLPRKKANAQRLLTLEQEHWAIENKLHYRRDVTLGEDACRVRVAGAPQVLAALNGGVLALMDWLHVSNVASQMRRFCALPHEALQLLCGELVR
jgi:predicted transposase YbfD/YdcC